MKKILFAASTIEHIKNFHMPYLADLKNSDNEIDILVDKEDGNF